MKGLLESSYFKTSPAPLLDMNEETRGLVVPGSPEQEDILDKIWAGCVDLFLPLSLPVSLSPFLFQFSLLHAPMHALHKVDILK